jgi:DNA primase
MFFARDFAEKLRCVILISEVIGKKVKLKSRGNEYSGLCPFHNEKTPSFTVNNQKGFYHCFGCQAHGDIISFVMKIDNLDYKEAVLKLAADFGIAVPVISGPAIDQGAENQLERDYLILEKICQFFEKNLYGQQGLEARNYLKKRHINSATAQKFRLGFALNSYEALTRFLKSENFAIAEILRTGVTGQNESKTIYDKFRNRIIFPITDKKNRVIAFGGRAIDETMPKYLNSAETAFFKKNQTLYNISFARKAIFSKGFAIIVEGYIDVITLFKNNIENVVAGLGTACGTQHLKELFYLTDKIVICLDGDAAGINAARRIAEISLPLINSKKSLFFANLPYQMDPDDFIKEFGVAEIARTFANAAPLSASLFEFTLMEFGIDKNKKISAENKARIEASLNAKIALIQDYSLKKYFTLFFKDLLFFLGRNPAKNQKNKNADFSNLNQKFYLRATNDPADSLARNIIAFLIKFPQLRQFRDDDFDIRELNFNNQNLSHLKELVLEFEENDKKNLVLTLENSEFSEDIIHVKNILIKLAEIDPDLILAKFRILLLQDLLLQVNAQYKDSLQRIEEIETHESGITSQKIKEIFDYKNSLEQKILSLERQII